MEAKRINLAEVKKGDRFWEYGPSGNFEFEAMADASVTDTYVQVQGRAIADGAPQAFGYHTDAPWFGPDLYASPAYVEVR